MALSRTEAGPGPAALRVANPPTTPEVTGRRARRVDPSAGERTERLLQLRPATAAAVSAIRAEELDALRDSYSYLLDEPASPLAPREGWFDPVAQRRWAAKASRRRFRWLVPFLGRREAGRDEWERFHTVGPRAAAQMMPVYRRQHAHARDERTARRCLRSVWHLAVLDALSSFRGAGPLERAAGEALFAHFSVLELAGVFWSYQNIGYRCLPLLDAADRRRLVQVWGEPREHAPVVRACAPAMEKALHRFVTADLVRTNAARVAVGVPESTAARWLEEKLLVSLVDARPQRR